MITIQVYRFDPEKDASPRYQSYEVPSGTGFMVLDALNHIRENEDPGLRYRHSCHMGKCGSCAVTVNGKPVLACWEVVQDQMVIEPLRGLPVIADLVVRRSDIDARVIQSPFQTACSHAKADIEEPEQFEVKRRQELDEIRKCMRCHSCVSVCPYIYTDTTGFIGPGPFLETVRFTHDPRTNEKDGLKGAVSHGVWDCLACQACVSVCPQEIDIKRHITDLRSMIMDQPELKGIPSATMKLNELLLKTGSPYGKKTGRPGQWAEGLDMKEMGSGQISDILFFPGCTLNSDAPGREAAQRMAGLMTEAGVDFCVGKKDEFCCGDPARVTGETELFTMLKEKNNEYISGNAIKKIITACPHGYHTLKNEYEQRETETVHLIQLLADKIKTGDLKAGKSIEKTVTYHDPCYLGRLNGIINEPRDILNSIPGLKLVEMERCGEQSLCCGGGGGGAFIETDAEPRIASIRAGQAADTGARILAVSCPFCHTMLEDAVKSQNLELEVRYLTDLFIEAM